MVDDDAIDLTLEEKEEEEELPAAGRWQRSKERASGGGGAGPSARESPPEVVEIEDDLTCALCGCCNEAVRRRSSCAHAVCSSCQRASLQRTLAACASPLPFRGAAALCEAAFGTFACGAKGCSSPLGATELETLLPPARLLAAHRWLGACAEAAATTLSASKGSACSTCGAPAASGHACLAARGATLELARALALVRAAHWAPGGAGGEGSGTGRKKARKAAGSGSGIGYGGAAGAPSKTVRAAIAKAEAQARAADDAMSGALTATLSALEALPLKRMPAAAAGLLQVGGCAPALRALLCSVSLFEAAGRGGVLRAALALTRRMAERPDCLPLLCLPQQVTRDVARPGALPCSAQDGEEEAGDARTVCDELHELAEQAEAVLAASGGRTGAGDDVSQLAGELRAAHEALKARRVRDPRLAGGARRRRAAAAAAVAAAGGGGGGGDAAAAEAEYQAVMGPQCFDSAPLAASHYFRREAPPAAGAGGEAGKVRMRRIVREAAAMRGGLPCYFGSAVAVRVDEGRADLLQVCIVPHRDTPYGNGIFIFDVLLPADYPHVPPKVQLLTTGSGTRALTPLGPPSPLPSPPARVPLGRRAHPPCACPPGKVRFNPNLYAEGKVCLSLLGTWQGPGWDANTSTLLQVLVSIQSLIFVERPWFNEPGYEKTEGTPQGDAQSEAYNAQVRADNVMWALLPALRSPPPAFAAFLVQHFRRKHDDIKQQLKAWSADARRQRGTQHTQQLISAADACLEALQRYAPRAASGPVETVSLL